MVDSTCGGSQVGTGVFVNLTQNMPPQRAPAHLHRPFGFSGDGADIWFAEGGDPLGLKVLMPVTGGTARPFLNPPETRPHGLRTATSSPTCPFPPSSKVAIR